MNVTLKIWIDFNLDIILLFYPLGLKESPGMPWAHSSLSAELIDEARRQMGVTYDQDNIQWWVLSDS